MSLPVKKCLWMAETATLPPLKINLYIRGRERPLPGGNIGRSFNATPTARTAGRSSAGRWHWNDHRRRRLVDRLWYCSPAFRRSGHWMIWQQRPAVNWSWRRHTAGGFLNEPRRKCCYDYSNHFSLYFLGIIYLSINYGLLT